MIIHQMIIFILLLVKLIPCWLNHIREGLHPSNGGIVIIQLQDTQMQYCKIEMVNFLCYETKWKIKFLINNIFKVMKRRTTILGHGFNIDFNHFKL